MTRHIMLIDGPLAGVSFVAKPGQYMLEYREPLQVSPIAAPPPDQLCLHCVTYEYGPASPMMGAMNLWQVVKVKMT